MAPRIPNNPGAWPRFMRATTAAAYVDEVSVECFLRKVGSVYPGPCMGHGRGAKWDREEIGRGSCPRFYPELEAMIERLLRIGVPLIMFTPQKGSRDASGNRAGRLYSEPYSQHLVQTARVAKELPSHVTLEGCRHGGMTELGDAELTEQEIMSLSGHVTPAAARLYVKRTETQRLQAAIKRRDSVDARTKKGRESK